jgi:hypothetical protein
LYIIAALPVGAAVGVVIYTSVPRGRATITA